MPLEFNYNSEDFSLIGGELTTSTDFGAQGSGDYIRVVGYATSTAKVIYFDPSKTWVELT